MSFFGFDGEQPSVSSSASSTPKLTPNLLSDDSSQTVERSVGPSKGEFHGIEEDFELPALPERHESNSNTSKDVSTTDCSPAATDGTKSSKDDSQRPKFVKRDSKKRKRMSISDRIRKLLDDLRRERDPDIIDNLLSKLHKTRVIRRDYASSLDLIIEKRLKDWQTQYLRLKGMCEEKIHQRQWAVVSRLFGEIQHLHHVSCSIRGGCEELSAKGDYIGISLMLIEEDVEFGRDSHSSLNGVYDRNPWLDDLIDSFINGVRDMMLDLCAVLPCLAKEIRLQFSLKMDPSRTQSSSFSSSGIMSDIDDAQQSSHRRISISGRSMSLASSEDVRRNVVICDETLAALVHRFDVNHSQSFVGYLDLIRTKLDCIVTEVFRASLIRVIQALLSSVIKMIKDPTSDLRCLNKADDYLEMAQALRGVRSVQYGSSGIYSKLRALLDERMREQCRIEGLKGEI